MKGSRTRQSILERAVDLASLEGLEGLTIGRLAEDLTMSKSGLFAHFGSKEELQLATVETAAERYIREIFTPALREPRGFPRLLAICESWLSYIRRGVFKSVDELKKAIMDYLDNHNGHPGIARPNMVLRPQFITALCVGLDAASGKTFSESLQGAGDRQIRK